MHQRGEIFHCVDHCGERGDKLVKETNEPTTWHVILTLSMNCLTAYFCNFFSNAKIIISLKYWHNPSRPNGRCVEGESTVFDVFSRHG